VLASSDPAQLEDDGAWELVKPDLSFRIWKFWKSFDFSIPLFDGGILNYPDWLLDDIGIFNWLYRMVERDS
jgi:hypothetical protein